MKLDSVSVVASKISDTIGPLIGIPYLQLIQDLRKKGMQVIPAGQVESEDILFPCSGKAIWVNGEMIEVFDFKDEDTAKIEEELLRTTDLVENEIKVIEKPGLTHFFRKGKELVVYVGRSVEILSVLERALGPRQEQRKRVAFT